MTQEADGLLKKALTLPPNDRATLAGSLIDSLEETDERLLKPLGMTK